MNLRPFTRYWWRMDISARKGIVDALWFGAGAMCATLILVALP